MTETIFQARAQRVAVVLTNFGINLFLSMNVRLRIYRAWIRVSSEYGQLVLGYFWETLSLFFVVSFLSLVWGRVLDSTSAWSYFFYVLLGFSAWSLMSRGLDQCLSFKGRAYVDMKRGASTLPDQFAVDTIYCFIQFLLTFPIVLVVCLIYFGFSIPHTLFTILALICIYITSYGLLSSLAILTIFYEDVSRLIRMIMRVAFLMTPILWYPEMLGSEHQNLIYLNPFYCYLDVYRSGLSIQPISTISVIVMVSITLLIHVLGKKTLKMYEGTVLRDIFLEKNV